MSAYEIEKTLVLSTGHIKKSDADKLTKEGQLTVWQSQFGFILYTGYDKTAYQHYSIHLRYLIKLARSLGCSYLKLDADGELNDNLECFDW